MHGHPSKSDFFPQGPEIKWKVPQTNKKTKMVGPK